MNAHRPEVADAMRSFETDYRERYPLSTDQARVVGDLTVCRTAALGGHQLACDACGHQEISYNSCRNRHCPKCQASARAEWLAERGHPAVEMEAMF